jgi:hypothetical protein
MNGSCAHIREDSGSAAFAAPLSFFEIFLFFL